MKAKLAVLAGFGAGYVLGARAGRERYDQIVDGARRLWQDPRVAEQRHKAAEVAKEQGQKAAGVAKEQGQKAAEVAKDQAVAAKDAVVEKVHGSSDEAATTPTATHSVPADELPDAPSYPV